MFICKFCQRECKNHNSLINHERLCKENPNRQRSYFEDNPVKSNPNIWNKGLTKETSEAVKRNSESLKKTLKETGVRKGYKHSDESKQKMSESRKQLYLDGWENPGGRCQKFSYDSPIAGSVKVDGTWELLFCKYLDQLNVKWLRNKQRFSYYKPNGIASTYCPDFYVQDWEAYIEVKGYETEIDRAKWTQFPHKLLIYKEKEIEEIRKNMEG